MPHNFQSVISSRIKAAGDFFKSIGKKQINTTMSLGTAGLPSLFPQSYGSGPKYPGSMSASRLINIHQSFPLRQSVRDMMHDSSVCRSMVECLTDATVDTGLRLKPTPDNDILGLSLEEAELWGDDVARRFHMWAKSKKSSRNRLNNFYQFQRMYGFFQQRDNDVFVRFFYGRDKDAFSPLQLDFIDPNQIKGYDYTTTYVQYGHNDDGIIRDDNGRETAYKIWNYDAKDGKYKDSLIPATGEKSGRTFMIHGYTQEYAGQGRGLPGLSHALNDFEKITDFDQATIQKAISQASLVMSIENDQKDPSNPFEGRNVGDIAQYTVPTNITPAEGSLTDEATPMINYSLIKEATLTQPGVGIFNTKRGDKINFLRDTSPSQEYGRFREAFISTLAASRRIPVEILLQKFNSNYSASRAAFITFYRVAQLWRNEMASDFLDPVYEAWLSEEIAAGRISAPGWSDPLLRAAWLSCEWDGQSMPNIDPTKTAAADLEYLKMSAHTLDDIARNYNGSSGKANRAKNKRQFSEMPVYPGDAPAPIAPEENEETNNGKSDDDID